MRSRETQGFQSAGGVLRTRCPSFVALRDLADRCTDEQAEPRYHNPAYTGVCKSSARSKTTRYNFEAPFPPKDQELRGCGGKDNSINLWSYLLGRAVTLQTPVCLPFLCNLWIVYLFVIVLRYCYHIISCALNTCMSTTQAPDASKIRPSPGLNITLCLKHYLYV